MEMKILLVIGLFIVLIIFNMIDPDRNYDLDGMKYTSTGEVNGK